MAASSQNLKLNRAFDVMAIALGEAGLDAQSIVRFVQNARQNFGVPHEDFAKTQTKAELAALAGELKENTDDSSVDGGSKAAQSGKASGTKSSSAAS